MSERVVQASPGHEAFYQDLVALLAKHGAGLPSDQMLAIAANAVGKILAMQDQRTMTSERAMQIVIRNIEAGNQHVIDDLTRKTSGRA